MNPLKIGKFIIFLLKCRNFAVSHDCLRQGFKSWKIMAVVVAQLVEQLLPTPNVRGSNPVISKIYITVNCIEKTKIKKKEAGNGPFFKKEFEIFIRFLKLSFLIPSKAFLSFLEAQ